MTTTTTTEQTQTPNPVLSQVKTYAGGCHCGAVRFEAELDLSQSVGRCNCSICTKVASSGVNVKPSAFRIVSGAENITQYRVGDSPNQRSFCKRCGIHCFGSGYVEEIGGDFCSVNVNCLDDVDPSKLTYHYWDGRHDNWGAGPRSTPWPLRA